MPSKAGRSGAETELGCRIERLHVPSWDAGDEASSHFGEDITRAVACRWAAVSGLAPTKPEASLV